jgi:L-threonylcarbamoyladenylate synthase
LTLQSVQEAAALLRRGGIVVYPTETFYGLGALASRGDALARLAAAKLRPEGKPLPLVAADAAQVRTVALLDDPVALELARRFWPGPLTLVLPAAGALDPALTGGGGTVGIRVPGSALARELARDAGGPLVSTSANLSGGAPPASAAEVAPELAARVDAVLDGGRTPGGLPSTVVAVEQGALRLLRDGAVPWREVAAVAALQGP